MKPKNLSIPSRIIKKLREEGVLEYITDFQFHQGLSQFYYGFKHLHVKGRSFNSIKDYLGAEALAGLRAADVFQFHQGLSASLSQNYLN